MLKTPHLTATRADQTIVVDAQRIEIPKWIGNLDMVLEVISTGSVEKDDDLLRTLYWQAGIAEYWLVDARGDRLSFDILRHSAKGYVATRKVAGWLKSTVFGKSFRLTRATDERGNPEFTLEMK